MPRLTSSAFKCLAAAFAVAMLGCASTDKAPVAPAAVDMPAVCDEVPISPRVRVETTLGDFVLELDGVRAPVSVRNFLAYARSGHYDETVFHRVIPGFMIQGGGFSQFMVQKPTREPIRNEAANGLRNIRGTVAMARTSAVDSATCQFFINLVDNPNLDYRAPTPQGFGYAVFGRVVAGLDTVDRIAAVKTAARGLYNDVPVEPVVIKSVRVVEKNR